MAGTHAFGVLFSIRSAGGVPTDNKGPALMRAAGPNVTPAFSRRAL